MGRPDKRQVADEVEKTLRAFDEDPPLQGNPFLAARIQAELESQSRGHAGFTLRVALKYGAIGLILIMNIVTALRYFDTTSTRSLHTQLVSDLEQDFQIEQSHTNF